MSASRLLSAAVLAVALLLSPAAAGAKSAKEIFAAAAGGVIVVIGESENGEQIGQGSGVVVGANQAATNCHVVKGAAKIRARQAAGERGRETYKMEAEVIARDDERDLCLLFIPDLSKPPAAPPAAMGKAKALTVGEEVFAIGAPQGFELSLSRGIVSQLRGDYGKDAAPYIQTDAAISPGSSGGGLFNEAGELVGITTFKYTGGGAEGLSFAIPVEWVGELQERMVKEFIKKLECFEIPDSRCLMKISLWKAREIGSTYTRASALSAIASAQIDVGDRNIAQTTIVTAFQAINNTIEESSNFYYANALLSISIVQAKIGNIAAALQTANKITDDFKSLRNDALSSVAKSQSDLGDIDAALQTVHKIEDVADRVGALGGIAESQAQSGNKTIAQRIFADALLLAGKVHFPFSRSYALLDIATSQIGAGEKMAARKTLMLTLVALQEMADRNFGYFTAMRDTAVAYADAGDFDTAFSIVLQIPLDEYSFHFDAESDIAAAQAEANDISAALLTIYEIPHDFFRIKPLNAVAIAQAKSGDATSAKETIEKIMRIVSGMPDGSGRADRLHAIALARAKIGDIRGALDMARQLGDSYHGAIAFAEIAAEIAGQRGGKM